jgi:predicted Fe-Mo cluster-binding NifX family protein
VAKDEAARDRLKQAGRGASVLVPLLGDAVAPRFDLATEVLIARVQDGRFTSEPRVVLLPGPSADELCSLVLDEGITDVVCGGIEDSHYQYLAWKKVRVVDRVIGSWEGVLRRFLANELRPGTVVRDAGAPPGLSRVRR